MAESVITVLPLYHKNVAVKVKMNVEDNLDSDIFYDFWQLSGCAVVLCHNVRHFSKITTEKITAPVVSAVIMNCSINRKFCIRYSSNIFVGFASVTNIILS